MEVLLHQIVVAWYTKKIEKGVGGKAEKLNTCC